MNWDDLLSHNDGVVRRSALLKAGLSRWTLSTQLRRCRWQDPLPGVVVSHAGPLSPSQWMRAALAYGGSSAVLSHTTAAGLLGLRITPVGVEITVPHGHRLDGHALVEVHQTRRPVTPTYRDGLPCTNVARTVVDLALGMVDLADVRALVSDAVQRGLTDLALLYGQIELVGTFGSQVLRMRAVMEEVLRGVRSAGEAELVDVIQAAGLPMPELNVRLRLPDGRYAVADGLWRAERVIAEVDGAEWHLNATYWQQDLARQNQLTTLGYRVLRFPVRRIRSDATGVAAEIRAALAHHPGG